MNLLLRLLRLGIQITANSDAKTNQFPSLQLANLHCSSTSIPSSGVRKPASSKSSVSSAAFQFRDGPRIGEYLLLKRVCRFHILEVRVHLVLHFLVVASLLARRSFDR
jgi:hypothetical protein